jgi:hypothetical protein
VTRAAVAAVALALAGAGCGSKHPLAHTPGVRPQASPGAAATPAGGRVSQAEVAIIRGWSDQLRHGHVAAATRYFAVPVTVANGTTVVLRTRAQVRTFNRTLPCGAKLARWQRAARGFVVATFTLTNRVGSKCDAPKGTLAAVAFLIRHRHIAQWLRVEVPGQSDASSSSAS